MEWYNMYCYGAMDKRIERQGFTLIELLGNLFQAEKMYYAENNAYTMSSADLFADIPKVDSTEHYFKYTIQEATDKLLLRARRKTGGEPGKAPNWNSNYGIYLNETGAYTTEPW